MKPLTLRGKRHHFKKRLTAQSGQWIRLLLRLLQDKQVQKIVIYTSGLVLLVYMLLWNCQIVLSTIIGIAIMTLVYSLGNRDLSNYWHFWRKFLSGSNRKLLIAVASGGFASFSTYLAASIWTHLENRWLATGTILQGLGTLIIMSLLSWHIFGQNERSNEAKLESYLADLTHTDPLKRLIALRYLSQKSHHPLTEHYRLMLSQETQPIVREALLDILAQVSAPVPLQVPQKKSRTQVVKMEKSVLQ